MIKIRLANSGDLLILCSLGEKTFQETYGHANSVEDMDKYSSQAFSENTIQAELSDKNAVFFIASNGQEDIGYAKIYLSKNPEELGNAKAVELQRMYSLKKCLGQGVGKELMTMCSNYAKDQNFEIVWTQVWGDMFDKNLKAIEFYKQWGFAPFAKRKFKLGDSEQEDILMMKKIE